MLLKGTLKTAPTSSLIDLKNKTEELYVVGRVANVEAATTTYLSPMTG